MPTYDPSSPPPNYGVPGYKRGSWGKGSVATHAGDSPYAFLRPTVIVDRFVKDHGGEAGAIEMLERIVPAKPLRYDCWKLALDWLLRRCSVCKATPTEGTEGRAGSYLCARCA